MTTNVEWPPLGPLPLDHAKLTFDLRELGGFAQTLCRVLVTLGVPDELLKVTCTRKSALDGGIEGPVVTSVEFPASTTLPSVLAFTKLTIEDTVEEGLRAVSHKALRRVMRDHYEHLRQQSFVYFPSPSTSALPLVSRVSQPAELSLPRRTDSFVSWLSTY